MVKDNGNDLTDLEYILKEILWAHQGREQAIHKADLCKALKGVGERRMRQTIKHLIIAHGYPIGSCPEGYFWAVTTEEIDGIAEYYRSYGLSCLLVASRIKKIPVRDLIPKQLVFDAMREKPGADDNP